MVLRSRLIVKEKNWEQFADPMESQNDDPSDIPLLCQILPNADPATHLRGRFDGSGEIPSASSLAASGTGLHVNHERP
jgi:hypothetical protein